MTDFVWQAEYASAIDIANRHELEYYVNDDGELLIVLAAADATGNISVALGCPSYTVLRDVDIESDSPNWGTWRFRLILDGDEVVRGYLNSEDLTAPLLTSCLMARLWHLENAATAKLLENLQEMGQAVEDAFKSLRADS